jgi:cytochrome P450
VEQVRSTKEVYSGGEEPTVIEALLDSDLPPEEKTTNRLSCESMAVILGGTNSISTVLTIATYHLLTNQGQFDRLVTELRTVVADETNLPPWSTLEKLPYLRGVILEALRLMYGVASRISLVAPDEELLYMPDEKSSSFRGNGSTSYIIPPGYAIGMSSYIIHTDPTLFPNASQFIPDRWLDEHGERERGLEKYLMSFSKGHRRCIGMQ